MKRMFSVAVLFAVVAFAVPAAAQERVVREAGGDVKGVRLEGGWAGGTGSPAIRLGFDTEGGFTPLIKLGFSSISPVVGDSSTALQLGLDVRYYFRPHNKGINPFGYAEVNLGLADADGVVAGAGGGAEYKFAKQFGVGGKWGIYYSDVIIGGIPVGGVGGVDSAISTQYELFAAFRF